MKLKADTIISLISFKRRQCHRLLRNCPYNRAAEKITDLFINYTQMLSVRDQDFLHYAKLLGIRACVFCNANYAVTFGEGADIKGKYELDHFKPQSRFSYLCTNFFNLFPVCGNCNKAKLHTNTTFSLFTEDPATMYPFTFTLDKASIIYYILSQDFEDLDVTFDGHSNPDHDTTFKINGIYGALKDVAEELVWKYKIYSPSYLKSLNDAFGKKFVAGGFNRLILGNYD